MPRDNRRDTLLNLSQHAVSFPGYVGIEMGEMCRYYNNQVYCIRAQYKDLNPDSNATHTIRCLTHTDQGPSQTLRGHCVPLKTHDNFCRFIYYAKNKTYIVQLKRRYKRSLQITRQSLVFSDVFFGLCMHGLLQYTALAFDYFRKF